MGPFLHLVRFSFFTVLFPLCTGAAPIEDNSFLIEEAYNQEEGVLQHIFLLESFEDRAWGARFTEEIPIGGMTHQASITLPYVDLGRRDRERGLGDMDLGYRYQLLRNEHILVAPAVNLLLPTGDHKKGLGLGATGVRFLIPVTIPIAPQWIAHVNAGYLFHADAKNAASQKSDIHGTISAGSLIYRTSDVFDLMLEYYSETGEEVIGAGETQGTREIWLNPGFRYAVNFADFQLVTGLAYLNGVGPTAGQTGFSFYLSFEHKAF
ncbi:MAG: transporter [Bdellovibrionales bacterium]